MFYQIERIAFTLSPEEHKKFARWLAAMIDEKDSIQSKLWGYLCEKQHLKLLETPEGKEDHARRWQEISEAIYPRDPKAPGKLEKMRGKLQEKLESFLAFQTMQEDQTLADTLLLRALLKKVDFPSEQDIPADGQESRHALVNEHIRHVFPIIYDKAEKRLNKMTQRDARYARHQFDRIRTMHEYRVLHKSPIREGTRLQDWISAWEESLRGEWFEFDLHVVSRAGDKQELTDALKPLEAFACLPFSPTLLQVGQRDIARPVSQLYYTLRLLQTSPNLAGETREAFEHFLTRRLKEDRPLFRPDEYATLHTGVFNYFSRRASETGAYYDVLYDMYTQARDHSIWPVTPLHYFTICAIYAGLCLSETNSGEKKTYLDEFYQFIQKYATYLLSHQQEETLEYNMALYHFCAGEFERIRRLVYTPVFRNPDYETAHEILIVRAAYEQKETPSQIRERIRPLYMSIRIKVGLDEGRRKGYLTELQMIRQLLNAKTAEAAEALKSQIQKTQPLSGRVWLLSKTDERIAELCPPTE